jgi:YebC/PmpR family DNA-binding regulatory protein
MAGHSKWQNIRVKKGAEDRKRAALFTKVARLITSAVKDGGSSDISSNSALRAAIDKARSVNMPKDNIERAITRGGGERGDFSEMMYEGYGPSGAALVIGAVTDNKNRTSAEIKSILKNFGGSLGEPGSASYAFSEDVPNFKVPVEDKEKFRRLLDKLSSLEDVVSVLHNGKL